LVNSQPDFVADADHVRNVELTPQFGASPSGFERL
jgi:hypothetical protein